jgi:8-oxo-dGTP diphosphatase
MTHLRFQGIDAQYKNDGSMKFLYVAGFLFREKRTQVALIEKQRPAWQKGKLNGIGGKIEIGETPIEAMIREFKEETGAAISDWRPFCYLQGASPEDPWAVIMFMSEAPAEIKTMEDEQVGWYPLDMIDVIDVIPNLKWLIPMAVAEPIATSTVVEG